MPQMKHPRGDVRVIPDVLVDQFKARGWNAVEPAKTSRQQAGRTNPPQIPANPEEQA